MEKSIVCIDCSPYPPCTSLLCRLHKPAQQTVLPAAAVPVLLDPLPIPKLKGLGAKFGEQVGCCCR